MATLHNFRQNTILGSLPAAEYERLCPHMDQVLLARGEVLFEPGVKMSHAYFPSTCIVGLISMMEIATVGNEGMIGVALILNNDSMPFRAIVQNPGYAYRIQEHLIKEEFSRIGGRRKGVLHTIFMQYTQKRIHEMSQNAICNMHHKLDQQLCRWLLLRLDKQVSNEIAITQELIADNLGVSRNAVSKAAGKLQLAGLINYSRGHLKVLNRSGLELRTCECYQTLKKASDRMLLSPHY